MKTGHLVSFCQGYIIIQRVTRELSKKGGLKRAEGDEFLYIRHCFRVFFSSNFSVLDLRHNYESTHITEIRFWEVQISVNNRKFPNFQPKVANQTLGLSTMWNKKEFHAPENITNI